MSENSTFNFPAAASFRADFAAAGFAVFEDMASPAQCDRWVTELMPALTGHREESASPRGGVRNLLRTSPAARGVALDSGLCASLRALLGAEVFPVRGILFDKTHTANWAVAWHQDLQIAVAERIETPGFGPWSVKAGVVHVQPPVEILTGMVTVRLHLDDCDETNGALEVIPGSHAVGVLAEADLARWRQRPKVKCCVRRGGVVLMRPLVLHASASATRPGHRRVLHLEYASGPLPNGLRWHEWD